MSHFQHEASNLFHATSLTSIFKSMSSDWVRWSHPTYKVEVQYDGWSRWLVRTYTDMDNDLRLYTVWSVEARSLSTLRRGIDTIKGTTHKYVILPTGKVVYEYN